MMNYDLNARIILRTPRFPVSKASGSLDEMLTESAFRDAIYLASDVLSEQLISKDFTLGNCSERMKHTLAKYHKRICYRPTPFGAFAGLALVPLNKSNHGEIVLNAGSFQTLVTKIERAENPVDVRYFRVNPFLYEYGSDFRVIARAQKDRKEGFNISEIFGSNIVRALVSVRKIISRKSLTRILRNNEINIEEIEWYINELIQLQILLPHRPILRDFPGPLSPEHKKNPGSSYNSYSRFSAEGSLPEWTSKQLENAIYCLDTLSDIYEPLALMNFKDRFRKLFERREIPLLQALDPEMGIDYDGLANNSPATSAVEMHGHISWSSLHELLISKWTEQKCRGIAEIEILDADLTKLPFKQKNYPPGSAVMFTVVGEKLHIKAAGGASSLNMIGRFTSLDHGVLNLAQELASREINNNPDIVFAEILHIDSSEVANVSRKETVYKYQIPFLESPEVSDELIIQLNDLYVSLVDGQIVLRSRRLNKQIIPRFSSAYNYQRSTLPVFRFLCDLQHEGIATNLNFSMIKLFPGLPCYPRVIYKNVILEAASWHIDAKQLSKLKKLDRCGQFHAFTEFATEISLPGEFCYEVSDQLLHINLLSVQDVSSLIKAIPPTGKIILREYYKDQESFVKDEKGKSYTHECIAFLTNRQPSYTSKAANSNFPGAVSSENDKLFPFNEWLYFKIYLHPAGYSLLLTDLIHPFISENLLKGNISIWFFVSYYDEDFHLRIRVKQIPGREAQILKTYKKLEHKLRQLPNIRKIEMSTYFQERERYMLIGTRAAEEFFSWSSEIVLAELLTPDVIVDPDEKRIFSGIRHVLMVCQILAYGVDDIEKLSNGFLSRLTKNQRLEFDLEFRENHKELKGFLSRYKEKRMIERHYLDALLVAIEPLEKSDKLRIAADLIHMHLNRHYLSDQGVLEMKTYYFLLKISRKWLKIKECNR